MLDIVINSFVGDLIPNPPVGTELDFKSLQLDPVQGLNCANLKFSPVIVGFDILIILLISHNSTGYN